MKRHGSRILLIALCVCLFWRGGSLKLHSLYETNQKDNSIRIVGDQFMINEQPLHIISGSAHYFRMPAQYWRDRLRKLKAAGLNSLSTYVEWSYHEPEERQYSFEGDRDVAQFVRIAKEEGLFVLLRPGPYICAERDLGGLPYWLLGKYPDIRLRTSNKNFINETKTWMNKLFEQLTPLLFGNGGPIILVQVENEYGSYVYNRNGYMEIIRDILQEYVGNNSLLYTTDGTNLDMIKNGRVGDTLTTVDFGVVNDVTNIISKFANLRKLMPVGPLMNSEFYPGWLTHWGESFQRVPISNVVRTLRFMLDKNINVNFYMFFGGSNFEFSSGANFNELSYAPDITSYDYDAPLSESGDITPKYIAIRNVLKQFYPDINNIAIPVSSLKGDYGIVKVAPRVSLMSKDGRDLLGKRYGNVTGMVLPTFEHLRQRAGLMLYETTINGESNSELYIPKPRDWIYIFVDGNFQGIINWMNRKYKTNLDISKGSPHTLSLLVENQGRINYGQLLHDFKGILSPVFYNNKYLDGSWTVTGYPLENVEIPEGSPENLLVTDNPILYEGHFTLFNDSCLDTFLDTREWGKGIVWINGHNLGRYWPDVGPQGTLYVPGVWLRAPPANNHIQILELLQAPVDLSIKFIDSPLLRLNGLGKS